MGTFYGFPHDVAQLMFIFLTPEATKNSEFVCKLWHNLINDTKNNLISHLKNLRSEELENLSSQDLKKFLFHYDTFSLIHDKISSLYYGQVFQNTDSFFPKSIGNYESLLFQTTELHPSFKRICFHYEPCKNFKHLMYAAAITRGSLNLQNLFLKSLDEYPFEMQKFPQLITNPTNLKPLHNHLIALRCLASCKNNVADMRMEAYVEVLHNYFQENINLATSIPSQQKAVQGFVKKHPKYINQPLWSTYAYGNIFSLLDNQLAIICQIANTTFMSRLDPETVKKFCEYFGALFPRKKSILDSMIPVILSDIYAAKGNNSEKLKSLSELSEIVDQDNLSRVVYDVVCSFIEGGQYDKALQILEEAHRKVGDSPFRFQLLFQRALCILTSQNKDHFLQAKEDIDAISTQFDILQTDEFYTPYVRTISEKENTITITENVHSIKKDQLLILKGSLAIYEQRFDDAFQNLKDITSRNLVSCEYPGVAQKVILGALKTQLPHVHRMPKELVKLFSKEISKKFSMAVFETPRWRNLILNYGDVLHYLLKSHFKTHLLDQQNFNQLEREILQSAVQTVQATQTSFEGKTKNKK
jgi:tetratricopeptide (TPR) repeat protein